MSGSPPEILRCFPLTLRLSKGERPFQRAAGTVRASVCSAASSGYNSIMHSTDSVDPGQMHGWAESFDSVLEGQGHFYAQSLLERLLEHARERGLTLSTSLNTPYINTIPVEQQ